MEFDFWLIENLPKNHKSLPFDILHQVFQDRYLFLHNIVVQSIARRNLEIEGLFVVPLVFITLEKIKENKLT